MSLSRSGSPASPSPWPCTSCTANGTDQSMSPTSQSDSPIPSDAADYPTSDSSDAGSYYSRAPTPQCLPLDDIIPEDDAISEAICHRRDRAWSLIVDSQSRAPTPCSGLNADPNADLEKMMSGNSAQLQTSEVPEIFDWQGVSGMAWDQLPDSDLGYQPGYQLTQEWLEQTIQYLKEIDDKERVAAEGEVDKRAEIGAGMETG